MSSVWHIGNFDLTIRMLLAAGLGGLIGLEREWNNRAAGFRTHILVCIGSAAIMLLSIYGFSEFANEYNVRMDPARLAAQVISGIGFLGAGAILRTGATVSGLTTAASIWVVAAIGLCAGAGFYYGAGLATVLVLLSLFVLNKWERYWMRNRRHQEVVIYIHDRPGILGKIAAMFEEQGVQIANVQMRPQEQPLTDKTQASVMELRFNVQSAPTGNIAKAIENISVSGEIISLDSGTWQASKTLPSSNTLGM